MEQQLLAAVNDLVEGMAFDRQITLAPQLELERRAKIGTFRAVAGTVLAIIGVVLTIIAL